MKNHLLFNCNRLLSLRICAIPTLDYASLKVDNLVGLMSSTWNSMVAENVGSARVTPQPTPQAPVFSRGLLEAERKVIRNAHGCFNCQKTPSSPGWMQHNSRNCPGNKSRGIAPRMVPAPHSINAVVSSVMPTSLGSPAIENDASISAVLPSNQQFFWDDDPRLNDALAAVLPSCILGNGTDSEGELDDD